MSDKTTLDEQLEAAAAVLIRCFWLGVICLTISFVAMVTVADLAYKIHSSLFSVSRAQFNMLHYMGMIMLKVAVFGAFLFPYIGIKLVLKKRNS